MYTTLFAMRTLPIYTMLVVIQIMSECVLFHDATRVQRCRVVDSWGEKKKASSALCCKEINRRQPADSSAHKRSISIFKKLSKKWEKKTGTHLEISIHSDGRISEGTIKADAEITTRRAGDPCKIALRDTPVDAKHDRESDISTCTSLDDNQRIILPRSPNHLLVIGSVLCQMLQLLRLF